MLAAIRRISLVAVATTSFAATSDAAVASPGFSLELAGGGITRVRSAEGGHAVQAVVSQKPGADQIVRKQLGVRYEDISVTIDGNVSRGVAEWIGSMFNAPHKAHRKSGAIVASGPGGQPMTRLAFTDAIVTEIRMPALDTMAKDPSPLMLKLAPWSTTITDASKEPVRTTPAQATGKQISPSRFKLVIAGLEEATKYAVRVEAITLKQKVVEHAGGERRDYEKEPANLETPNLVVTFSEPHAEQIYTWHHSFVINGQNGQDKEKTGTLEYLSEDLSTTLFTLDFHGLGIFKLTPDKHEAGGENIKRVKAEMYCEQMTFRFHLPPPG